jgi:hypothetical protein
LAQALPYITAEGENMMLNCRKKLSIGFGGLMAILVLIGSEGI